MVRLAPVMRRVAVAGLTLVGMVTTAPIAQAETLGQALVRLYNTSPDLMAARYVAENSNEVFNQVAANALPQISSTWQGSYDRTYTELLENKLVESAAGRPNPSTGLVAGISVSQTISPVVSGGVVQTRKSIEGGWIGYDQSEQQIILNGIIAYLGVIRARQSISLQAGNITLLENQLAATQSRYDAGLGTRTDIAQVAASLADARAGVQQANGDFAISRATYRQVYGVEPQDLVFPGLPARMPANLQQALATALANNPSVLLAQVSLDEAKAKKKVTEAELKPAYQVGVSAQRNQDATGGSGTTTLSTSFGVSIPIYGNRQISKSKVRQDEIAIRRLQEQLTATKSSVELQVIQAWNQFQTAQAVGGARASQITAAELSLRGSEAELDAGTKTGTDVISSQQALTQAQVAAANARVDVVQGAYTLMSAMGMLSARDLRLPVQYYVPEKEFENRRIENLATLLYDRQ